MASVQKERDGTAAEKAVKVEAEHEEEDDDEEQGPDGDEQGAVDAKKKKKKRNKKKKPAAAVAANGQTAGDAPKETASTGVKSPAAGAVVKPAAEIRGLASQGSSEFPLPKEQSYPPRKPVHEIFTNGKFPPGKGSFFIDLRSGFLCCISSIKRSI